MTDGLVYVVSPDPALTTIASLKGKRLALPFRNDTPDILMQRLMQEAGMAAADVEVVAAANPIEAVQLLLTGRADAGILPEPAGAMAEMRAAQEGRAMHRTIDMQAEWAKITGLGPSIPQAGLGVTQAFIDAAPEAAAALQAALVATLPQVLADPMALRPRRRMRWGCPRRCWRSRSRVRWPPRPPAPPARRWRRCSPPWPRRMPPSSAASCRTTGFYLL